MGHLREGVPIYTPGKNRRRMGATFALQITFQEEFKMTCFIVYYQRLYYSGYVNDRVFLDEEAAQQYVDEKQAESTDRAWNYEPSLLG